MSSEASVDGNNKLPPKIAKPHRCNARLEDFIQAMVTLKFSEKIAPTWKNFRRCLAAEPGKEPDDPYIMIDDPQKYLDPRRMQRKQIHQDR